MHLRAKNRNLFPSGARPSALVVSALTLLLGAHEASAQTQENGFLTPTYNLQLFRPAIDSKGYVTLNASQVLGHKDISLGLVGTWASNPLVLTLNPGETNPELMSPVMTGRSLTVKRNVWFQWFAPSSSWVRNHCWMGEGWKGPVTSATDGVWVGVSMTSAARAATVGFSKSWRGVSVSPASRARAMTWMERMESPPSSKNLSCVPTRSRRRTLLQMAASLCSLGVVGAVKVRVPGGDTVYAIPEYEPARLVPHDQLRRVMGGASVAALFRSLWYRL